MRTFIFIKNVKNVHGKMESHIVGMTQSETYPSGLNTQGGQYENCQCIEVSKRHYDWFRQKIINADFVL